MHVTSEIRPNFVPKLEVYLSVNRSVVHVMYIIVVWFVDIVFISAVLLYVLTHSLHGAQSFLSS